MWHFMLGLLLGWVTAAPLSFLFFAMVHGGAHEDEQAGRE